MPTYEYRCKSCRRTFIKRLPMGEAKETDICPICGYEGDRVYHMPHVVGFVAADANDPEQWRGV